MERRGASRRSYASSDDEDYDFDDEEDYEVEEIELNEEDANALSLWMGPQGPPRTIADLIMEKIREKELMLAGGSLLFCYYFHPFTIFVHPNSVTTGKEDGSQSRRSI